MMKLIVGLGNPGNKYAKTRHNLGFLTVDFLASELGVRSSWFADKKLKSEILKVNELPTANQQLILAKPQTFVNNAGIAVKKIVNFYKLAPEEVLVIRDDIDLAKGKIKGPYNKTGSGGHRGAESIMEALGTDKFYQLKIGVGRPLEDVLPEDWVLENLIDKEWESFAKLVKSRVVLKAKNWVNE